jgi:quercetin dioxygenase-like cupin family protein
MNSKPNIHGQDHQDLLFLFVLQALSPREIASVQAQISYCEDCRREIETLRPIAQSFVGWSTDVLRPAESLWDRLAKRIASEGAAPLLVPPLTVPVKPDWEEAAPGIHVKILAKNDDSDSVSMLVRLDPGTDYPGHTHAGIEELHLLHGILKVDDRTLYPGDFIHSEAGSVDHRVWSETGCTCFLMTSTKGPFSDSCFLLKCRPNHFWGVASPFPTTSHGPTPRNGWGLIINRECNFRGY